MSMPDKPDLHRLFQFLDELPHKLSLGNRGWWVRYLFHYTHLDNLAAILSQGQLHSRQTIETTTNHFTDSASPDIIDQTDDRWKTYVRFYFRPRTPTLYRNEGFRPAHRRQLGSHCPIPVYLLFDAKAILRRADSQFSSGSLASRRAKTFDSVNDFLHLPFHLIYHDTWFAPEERNAVIHHRQAEVIVPHTTDLGALRYIWCRSQAEFETLRQQLIESDLWSQYHSIIRANTSPNLFFREWVFIEQVFMSASTLIITFNLPRHDLDQGPFNLSISIWDYERQTERTWTNTQFTLQHPRLSFDLSLIDNPPHYTVAIWIDGILGYINEYDAALDELPF